jgi:CRISPR-associated protein Cas2
MDYLVVYDIADPKRLRRIAKVMETYGNRVQKSVFECSLSSPGREAMLTWAATLINPATDSIRLYPLYNNARLKQTILGTGEIEPAQTFFLV